ncbi:PR-1-like protein [Ophiobolus disseminans]|uniref:PR-1-like protein n=1 Tax=Ophiobolus disseminans TaxID=1469910 RepID=A0A6A7AGQ0_9PLEO|nr:PR-1-like protein [Ophiobolus disseminans]
MPSLLSIIPILPILLLLLSTTHAFPQSSPSPESSSPEYTSNSTFRETVLNVTNTFRTQHNATSLSWNETLEEEAEKWAGKCGFGHSGGPAGENLAAGYANVTQSISVWADERVGFDFRGGEFSTSTGHFTQLVWRTTSSVGCARTLCNGGSSGGKGDAPGWFLVCEYWPGGNVIGQFKENVHQREGVSGGTRERGVGCWMWALVLFGGLLGGMAW